MTHPSGWERGIHILLRVGVLAAALVVALSTFYVAPPSGSQPAIVLGESFEGDPVEIGGASAPRADAPAPRDATSGSPAADTATAAVQESRGLSCPGNNGGKTDVGVDAGSIRLASTEVRSGIGFSFLGSARYGMLAVVQKINRRGGICGRQIVLDLKDDGWDAQRGKQFINNFILSGRYLALAVVPSSNGLDAASKAGDLARAPNPMTGGRGIPVVGTDGMLNSQYADPFIWPVAASTATTMRIMARDAVERGKERLPGRRIRMGIVYDRNYPFGPEGAGAFVRQAARDGAVVPSECREALTAGQNSYATQVKHFNDNCGEGAENQVDFVALLLEPQTAATWLRDDPYLGSTSAGGGLGFGGPQPLFDANFANACGQICNNLAVWTSFFPPLEPYVNTPAVQGFKADLCAVDSNCNIDALNAFTEGAYVGMLLVVRALEQISPIVTRDRLRAALDTLTLDVGLTAPLSWRRGDHYANKHMIAFRNTYSGGAASFQFIPDSEYADPCPGCVDPPLPS